jgi:hypothetical protein
MAVGPHKHHAFCIKVSRFGIVDMSDAQRQRATFGYGTELMEIFLLVAEGQGGALLVTNPPFRFSNGLAFARGKAPRLGEDTAVVLKSMLGLEEADVAASGG